MKQTLFILIIFFSLNSFSQQKKNESVPHKNIYIPLKIYKKEFKKPLTKQDSLNFKFSDSDTLVLVKNYIRPKGVSVPYEYKDSTFLHYYKKIAFNHKNDSLSKKTTMKYWKDDIKIFFSKSVSRKTKKEFMDFAESIDKKIDSLTVFEVKRVEDSNYIIYYFNDFEYESRMVNYKNSDYYMYWNGKNQIYRNTIKLDSKLFFNEKLRLYELKKFFLKSLGHFNFISDFDCSSYFSNCYSKEKTLNLLDIELLKYHYSYGICKGTDLETFEEQHKIAKETLKKHNHKINFFHSE